MNDRTTGTTSYLLWSSNNHVHSAMQQLLFLLDMGPIPHMGFKPEQNPSSLEMVNKFTKRIESVRGPLTHDPRVPSVASQHNFIV